MIAADAWTTWSQLRRVERKAEGRDKAFEDTATDTEVQAFAEKYGEEVRYVNLKCCKAITDAAVKSLAQHCPNIETLSLTDCHQVTDEGVIRQVTLSSSSSPTNLT